MARWRLLNAHYLNVPDNEWEYKETNRDTGRQVRKVFPVPRLLDTNDQSDYNYPGEIIVTDGKSHTERKDIIFFGPPTPDMEPLDDEAQAISDAERHKWIHPIESLPGQGYGETLLADLQRQLSAAAALQPTPAVSVKGVDPADFAKLQEQVAALLAQNLELKAQVPERRI